MYFPFLASYKRRPAGSLNQGFSMIELMVSIAIVVLVLTVTLTRQDSFNSAVLLRSEAFDLALAIREMQLGAVSAQGDGAGGYRATQGVYFDIRPTGGDPQQYTLFRDSAIDGNNIYDGADSGEALGLPGSIDSRFEITEIEMIGSTNSDPDTLSVVFRRPNFDAQFYENRSTEIVDATAARIRLSVSGSTGSVCGEDYREIEITATGQITVLNCN